MAYARKRGWAGSARAGNVPLVDDYVDDEEDDVNVETFPTIVDDPVALPAADATDSVKAMVPQVWSRYWQEEIGTALRRSVAAAKEGKRTLTICVTNDPIVQKGAFKTLDDLMEHTGLRVPWKVMPLNTLDVQLRTEDDEVVAAFELKTVADYLSAMGAQSAIKVPECKLQTGRMAAQRERADDLDCPVFWIIKSVQDPGMVPLDLLSAMASMELLNPRQRFHVAANDADVIRHILTIHAKITLGPHLKHHKAILVDRPNMYHIKQHPLAWMLVAVPHISIEAALAIEEVYPTMEALMRAYQALPAAKRPGMLQNLKITTAAEVARREKETGRPVMRFGPARSAAVAEFMGVWRRPEEVEKKGKAKRARVAKDEDA